MREREAVARPASKTTGRTARTAALQPGTISVKVARASRTQAQRSENTKHLILETSARLLRQNGIDGLRTAEVAAAAGVSQGAQFHHFPNKEALVVATLEFVNARLIASTRAKAKSFDADADPIEAIIADANNFFMGDYFFVELAMGLTGKAGKPLLKRVRNQVREARFEVENVWKKRLEDAGLSSQVAADILDMTFNMVRGFAVRRQLDPDTKRFTALYEVWRHMIQLYVARIEPESAFLRAERVSQPSTARAKAQKAPRRRDSA